MALIGPRIRWQATSAGTVPPPPDPGTMKSGITLGLFPSNPSFDVELWRSTQSSTSAGSSSKWGLDQTFGANVHLEIVYQDVLLQSTRTFYYRARHNLPGFSPGPFTTVVSARPRVIGTELSISPPSFGSTALRMTGITPGSTAIAKTIVFHAANTLPQTSTTPWVVTNGYLGCTGAPFTTGVVYKFFVPVTLPKGIVVTKYSVRGWAQSNSFTNKVDTVFQRFSTVDGSVTSLASALLSGASGWQTVSSSSSWAGERVAQNSYHLRVNLIRNTGSAVRFLLATFSYKTTVLANGY